jgi:hypothetical protein
MTNIYTSHNNYQSELSQFSSNPYIQQMAANQLKTHGSIGGIYNSVYGGTTSNNSNSQSYSNNGASSTSVSSNGKYMVHCYYGYHTDNKITTVIG